MIIRPDGVFAQHLSDRVEALFHALGELVELIFAEKSFSHSDVPPNVEILSQVSALGTQS